MYFTLNSSDQEKYKAVLNNTVGMFYQVVTLDDGQEEELLIATQPWKPNPDGTTANWINEEDLVNWFSHFIARN